jgi:hypothetical protein
MEKIDNADALRAAIIILEAKQEQERILLKNELYRAYESMKPINLIKNTFKEVVQSQDTKDNLLTTGVGIAIGYVSKALFEVATRNVLRKSLGNAIMFGITSAITKNPEVVKSITKRFFNLVKGVKSEKGEKSTTEETKAKPV